MCERDLETFELFLAGSVHLVRLLLTIPGCRYSVIGGSRKNIGTVRKTLVRDYSSMTRSLSESVASGFQQRRKKDHLFFASFVEKFLPFFLPSFRGIDSVRREIDEVSHDMTSLAAVSCSQRYASRGEKARMNSLNGYQNLCSGNRIRKAPRRKTSQSSH